MKQIVLDQGVESIDLYGFSADGGTLINAIGVLNTSTYDAKLKKIGIELAEKEKLLAAISERNGSTFFALANLFSDTGYTIPVQTT